MTVAKVKCAPETCVYCTGTGSNKSEKCPVCSGQGSVLVAQPPRRCAYCGGKGTYQSANCTACKGTGWAHAFIEEEKHTRPRGF